jgi:hypothetical protein
VPQHSVIINFDIQQNTFNKYAYCFNDECFYTEILKSCCAQFSFIILSVIQSAIVQCVDLVHVIMLSVVVLRV